MRFVISTPLKNGKVLSSEEHVHVVCEHRRSTGQVFPVVRVMTCEPFVAVDAARRVLRVFRGETDPKVGKSSGLASFLVAGRDIHGTDEM